MAMRSGFVTGLAVEIRVLRHSLGQDGAEPLTACAGADAARARAAAEALVAAAHHKRLGAPVHRRYLRH